MYHQGMKIFLVLLLLLPLTALAEEPATSGGGTLPIGPELTYKRGTAVATEQLLKFPYRHIESGREFWAWIVHEGQGCRLIAKEDEAVEGKNDKSGNLINHDFEKDHPFQKTIDQIKYDAIINLYKDFQGETSIDPEGWKVLGDGSAINKTFYKDSQLRVFALLAVKEEGRETLTGPPMLVKYERSNRGPLMSVMSGGQSWSSPQLVNAQTNLPAHRAFRFLESRKGY